MVADMGRVARISTRHDAVWRECARCGVPAPLAPDEQHCSSCRQAQRQPEPKPEQERAGRRPRVDAGSVRLTARDLAALSWLADMKAIYEPDVAALVAGLPAAPGAVAGYRPSPRAVRFLLSRWRRAGVAEPQRLVAGRSRIVRVTTRGAALIGVDGFRETAEVTAYHQCEVSRLRLWLESRPSPSLGQLVGWESERAFRADLDALGLSRRGEAERERMHVPDGVATYERGERVAVEVERAVKAPARLARIVEQLLTDYPVTLYAVASGEVRRAVLAAERAARRTLGHRQISADRIGALSVIDLPDSAVPDDEPGREGAA